MRVLIGTYDICGWIGLLQKDFIRLGHTCDTLVKEKNPYFGTNNFTYNVASYLLRPRFTNNFYNRFRQAINRRIQSLFYKFFLARKPGKYDLVIYLWSTIDEQHRDVKLFKEKGAKIVFLFAGSEVRSLTHFSKAFEVSNWTFPEAMLNEDISAKKRYISTAEQYADLIYSVPDQSGLQTRPFYHLTIPIDLEKFTFSNNRRKVPKVLHLPSEPWKKGTDVIEASINELLKQGMKFEFHSMRNLQHDQIPALLRDMDVLIDEIVFHGPGVLSFEAMASGCAVATRYLESSPECFRPPVWNIDASNIRERLSELLQNFELQQQLISEGRRYVENHNQSLQVTQSILDNLHAPRKPDYRIDSNEFNTQ